MRQALKGGVHKACITEVGKSRSIPFPLPCFDNGRVIIVSIVIFGREGCRGGIVVTTNGIVVVRVLHHVRIYPVEGDAGGWLSCGWWEEEEWRVFGVGIVEAAVRIPDRLFWK